MVQTNLTAPIALSAEKNGRKGGDINCRLFGEPAIFIVFLKE